MMNYPAEILPQPNYTVPFPFEELQAIYDDYLLCYRIEGTIEENQEVGLFNGLRKLKKSCFTHLPHMSMNLLGGFFLPEYVRFVQRRPACDEWDGTTSISLEDYLSFVEEKTNATPIFYKKSSVCSERIKTSIHISDKKQYDSIAELFKGLNLPPYRKNNFYEIFTEIRIEHVPTNLNYWHVQMEVYPPNSQQMLKDNKATWRERIFKQIRDSILCYRYITTLPLNNYQIPEHLYIKKSE